MEDNFYIILHFTILSSYVLIRYSSLAPNPNPTSLLKEYIDYIPIYEDLLWSSRDELLGLENLRFKEIINRITARFRGKTPAEMNDESVRQDRKNKRLKNLAIGILTVLFILSVITTWLAIKEKNRANEQYRKSVSLRLASESSLALLTDNVKAIRIAVAAYSTQKQPFYTAHFKEHTDRINSAVFSPDGKQILTASSDHTAKLWDLKRNLLADFKGHIDSVNSAFFPRMGNES